MVSMVWGLSTAQPSCLQVGMVVQCLKKQLLWRALFGRRGLLVFHGAFLRHGPWYSLCVRVQEGAAGAEPW